MPRRLGLYGPFIALAIAAGAGGLGWLGLKDRAEQSLDRLAARAAASGGAFTWRSRRISGFPFHLDVDFGGVAWRDPSGWAIAAPALNTEASVFAPGHWVAVAPAGAVISRPTGGSVKVTAKALRASLFDIGRRPPSFSLEGIGVGFSPMAGAAPWLLTGAGEVHVHTRAGPADQGAFYVELDQAVPGPGGALSAFAAGKPVTVIADAIYGHARALTGRSWAEAVSAWTAAGGQVELRRLRLAAGDTALDAHGAGLTVGGDGRLEGALSASVTQPPRVLARLVAAGVVAPEAARSAGVALAARGAGVPVNLQFQAGQTTLGPVALLPAPKVY
jgi:hypothetical protein